MGIWFAGSSASPTTSLGAIMIIEIMLLVLGTVLQILPIGIVITFIIIGILASAVMFGRVFVTPS